MKRFKWLALFLALAMVAAACGDDDSSDTTAGGDGGGDLAGTEVSIFGAFTTVEASAANSVIDTFFEASTGGSATYEGSESFEEQVKIRVDGGSPPDIALYPQPGSVVEQGDAGNAIALEDLGIDIAALEANYGEYLVGLGVGADGKHYGIPTNVNTKGLIWYPIPEFTDAGYEIPATWDELIALSDQIVADGNTPWCHGIGSDANTGWPATDWVESIMLNTAGVDLYDQWWKHEIPFNHPSVKRAVELFGDTVFPEGYTLGGSDQVPAIDFRDAPDPLFNDPPSCFLFRQASFIVSFFPEGLVAGEDYGFFGFPTIDEGVSGALVAGELAAVFRDAPEVRAFIESYTSQEVQCAIGGFEGVQRISPNLGVGADCYADELYAGLASSIVDALASGGARFDASDLMPSSVGSGSFWTGMVDFMQDGPGSVDEVLQKIEDSWPSS